MKYGVLGLWLALAAAGEEKVTPAKKSGARMVRVAVAEQEPPLERGAFAAKMDGAEARVLKTMGPEDDLVILLALDWAGEPTLVDTAREAVVEEVRKLAKNHWVGLFKTQDVLVTLEDPTADRERIGAAVKNYAAVGKAGFFETVERVAEVGQRMMERTGVRVAVVYVTDSNIYNYREDYTNPVVNASDARDLSRRFPDQLVREKLQKVSDRLARLETPVYVVHLNYFSDPINEAYQRGLLQLATESGGEAGVCRSRGEIGGAVARIFAAAARHWKVVVEVRNAKARTVMVDLFNGERDVPNRARFVLGK